MLKKVGKFILRYKFIILGLLIASFGVLGFFNTKKTYSEKTYTTIWDGTIATSFSGGTGTNEDPYIISDGSELAYFFYMINSEASGYFNKTYVLDNNIDLNGYDFSNVNTTKTFSGILDGKGYTVSNFTLNNCMHDGNENVEKCALFNNLSNAQIKNINFIDGRVELTKLNENTEVSLLANTATNSIIKNISFSNITFENSMVKETTQNENVQVEEQQVDEQEVIEEQPVEQEVPEENQQELEEQTEDTIEETPVEEPQSSLEETNNLVGNKVVATQLLNVVDDNQNIKLLENELIEEPKTIKASGILINDNGNNEISNIHITLNSNIENTSLLVYNYNESNVFNIVTNDKEIPLSINNTIETNKYTYKIVDNELVINNDVKLEEIFELLESTDEYKWTYDNNTLRLRNNGVDPTPQTGDEKDITGGNTKAGASGISGNIITVDDIEADRNYYLGLNYTNNAPNITYTNTYSDSNLITATINYYGYGKDTPSVSGYVSNLAGESNLNTYVYKKVYPKVTCSTGGECIKIELLDNPWSKRPNNKMFNGWYSDSNNVTITLDLQTYTRYAEVKLNGATSVNFNLYTSWAPGVVVNISRTWNNIEDEIEPYGFSLAAKQTSQWVMSNYYYTVHVSRYLWGDRGDYVNQGSYYTQSSDAPYCTTRGGCDYIRQETASSPNGSRSYFIRNDLGGGHYSFTPTTPAPQLVKEGRLNYGDELAGLYRKHHLSNGQSQNGYYNVPATEITIYSTSGWGSTTEKFKYYTLNKLSGNCSTSGGCDVFEYIPYISGSNIYQNGDTSEYYYLTTRDTNIVFLNENRSETLSANGSNIDRPFTITAYNNGVDNYSRYTWTPRTTQDVKIGADVALDYIRISTTRSKANGENTPASNSPSIDGNGHNLKIGRNVGRNGNYMTFDSVVSFNRNDNVTTPIKFNTRIESGYYNSIAGLTKTTGYFESKVTYGNDLDRIRNDNSKLDVAFVAMGVTGGTVHSQGDTVDALTATIKSGTFGSNRTNYTTGVYAGGRNSGTMHAPMTMIVEGGSIYNLTGGPLIDQSKANSNIIKIYVKGGTIDNIFGGAGTTQTYGNRIIQLTGGQINYSVVGGSNGVQSSGSDGKLNGKTFIYAGGNVVVGNPTYVNNNTKESASKIEAGSIFGSGNGKEGTAATSQIGDTLGTNIVITSGATIRRNVYGGGNYGSMGSQATSAVATNIKIYGGTVSGSVYGGGNNNGIGRTNYNSTVNIEMTSGNVGNIYGGSNVTGTVYASSTINVTGGTVSGSVYGGGKGSGTIVRDNVVVNIGTNTTTPTIGNDVYGGSEQGQVNTTAGKSTIVTINNGAITNSVYGGGFENGVGTTTVTSSTRVTVNGGTVNGGIYGGSNSSGTIYGSTTVEIKGGSVGSVYGGGKGTSTFVRDNVDVTIGGSGNGPRINTYVYGGSQLGTVNGTATNETYHPEKHVNVVVNNGNIGEAVFGGAQGSTTATPNVYGKITTTINGGTIKEVYGGFNISGAPKGSDSDSCVVLLKGGTIGDAFGGGKSTDAPRTNITLDGAVVNNGVYGGSNEKGTVTASYLYIKKGYTGNAYGGNNQGGTNNNPIVTVTGGTINSSLYGSGNKVGSTTTNVTINATDGNVSIGNNANAAETYPGAFGGANQASVTTTNITINQPTGSNTIRIKNAFGGSNTTGDITTANLTINGGEITANAFGGNNKGGNVTTPNIVINGGKVGNAYGGNNEGGISNNTDLIINGGEITNDAFGGGNKVGITNSKIHLNGGTIRGSAYGGSNSTGEVIESHVYVTNTTGTLNVGSVYGGNNQGGLTRSANVEVESGTIANVFGGGNHASTNTTNVLVKNGTITKLYGGGNEADVNGDIDITVQNGNITDSLFGGGNLGNVGSSSNSSKITIDINNGTIGTIYAGGNGTSGENGKLFGNTELNINNGQINNNIFGGGNNGSVTEDTLINIKGGSIYNNAFAGGNGSTATVFGNNTINISGTASIGHEVSCEIVENKSVCTYEGSVFGGGNAAATGRVEDKKSTTVNIAGGTIYENVYGGAYGFSDSANNLTSVIYGTATVNVGNAVPATSGVQRSAITIYGTIFGGGEKANNDNENYNFDAISVTDGITINIDGTGYETLNTYGSIFGSGNASSSQGPSTINITNYGTRDIPHSNISIQRTDNLTINNSHIVLSGTTDSTNDYSNVPFTLSRIKHLYLKNNSTLYLYEGSNLLEEFNSQDANGAKAYATITETDGEIDIERNVDNRVYMYPGKVLNIATTQNVSQDGYGKVNGMTFFGMFKIDKETGKAKTGIYQDTLTYPENANEVSFEFSTYVLGEHKIEHNIEVDGFYSNFYDEADPEEGTEARFYVDYINPTPENASYYMWQIGEDTLVIDVELTASKYATLGTKEIVFNQAEELSRPNTSFMITGFDYTELEANSELIPRIDIPRLASTTTDANNKMGLRIEASNQGWLTSGHTDFVSNNPSNAISGVTNYIGSNTSEAPTLLMYLYHSKNIDQVGDFGTIGIDILAITQIDDLTKSSKPLHISVKITRAIYDTAEYEASITPGRKYELFTNTATNITAKSTFSAYYSLFDMPKTETNEAGETVETYDGNIYSLGNYRHVLTTTYALPAGTKITMIDLSNTSEPEYFYHVITNEEHTNALRDINTYGDYNYDLGVYEKMGAYSSGIRYNDEKHYYNLSMKMTDEEFIFIVDFENTDIVEDTVLNKSLYMELIDDDPSVPDISLLSVQRDTQVYSLYKGGDASINIDGRILDNKQSIYTGDSFKSEANIEIVQQNLGSSRQVYDTKTFDSKLGVKISLINASTNEIVSGTSLLGLTYTINDNTYFPNIDGITRIKIADRVDQTKLRISINTGTSSIETGQYTLRIETFASSDGIYFGTTSNTSYIDLPIYIINEIYGLKVEYKRSDKDGNIVDSKEDMIISSKNGHTEENNDTISMYITYNSGLTNPNIKLKMYRRLYDTEQSTQYEEVEICDYIDNSLNSFCNNGEAIMHTIITNPTGNQLFVLHPIDYSKSETPINGKDHLQTGTYKLEFILYETLGSSQIKVGSVEKYIIIR